MKRYFSFWLLLFFALLVANDAFATAPSVQSRYLAFWNITASSASLQFTRGNGNGRIVVIHYGGTVNWTDFLTNYLNPLDVSGDFSNLTDANGDLATAYADADNRYQSGGNTYVVVDILTGTARSTTLSNLTNGTTYNVFVFEYNISGTNADFNTNTATNNPRSFTTFNLTPPSGLSIAAWSEGGKLSWTTDGTGATGYYLTIKLGGSPVSGYDNLDIGKPSTKAYEIMGLSANTAYTYEIRSYDNNGNLSSAATGSWTTLINPSLSPCLPTSYYPGNGTTVGIGGTVTITLTATNYQVGLVDYGSIVNGEPLTSFTDNGDGTYTIVYTVIEGDYDVDDNDDDLPLYIDLMDGNGVSFDTYCDGEGNVDDAPGIDANRPGIINVTSTNSNGSYGIGSNINVRIQFSEPVTFTPGTGQAQLTLNTTPTNRIASSSTGQSGTDIDLSYTVQEGDQSSDLDYTSSTALSLSGTATIKDAAGNDADLGLPTPGDPYSLGDNKSIVIDGVRPYVASIVLQPSTPTCLSTSATFRVTFSENINPSTLTASDFTLTTTGGVTGTIGAITTVTANTVFDVGITGITGTGTLRLDFTGSVYDAVTYNPNASTATYTSGTTADIDNTAPTAIISGTSGACYATAPSIVSGTASDVGCGGVSTVEVAIWVDNDNSGSFTSGDYYYNGSNWTTATSEYPLPASYSSGTWTYPLPSLPNSNARYYVQVRATDGAGNTSAWSSQTGWYFIYDAVAPVVSITSPTTGCINGTQTITRNITETNQGSDEARLFWGSPTNYGSWTTYTPGTTQISALDGWSSISDGSSFGIEIRHTDCANNSGTASVSGLTKDVTAPYVVSITRYSPFNQYTNASLVTWRVIFSEDVSGVTASNFSVTVVSGSVTNFGTLTVSGGPTVYDVWTNNTITGEGEFRLDLTSITNIVDCASNGLTGTYTSGETYIRDVTAPSVVSVVRQNPTTQYITGSTASTVFRVTFSEPINASTVAAGDFTFTVVSGSISSPSISSVSQVNTTTWDVTVTGWTSSENAEFRLDVNASSVSDLAGNTGPTSAFTGGQTYILDNTNPTATFDQANNCYPYITQLTGTASDAGTPASGVATVEVAIWKDNNRNGTFDSGTDFYWGGTAFDQSSPTWNTATYASGNWSYSISINSGDYDYYVSVRVTDNAGNQATAVTNSKVTVDAIQPSVVSITRTTPSNQYTNATQVTWTVTFSEDVSGVSASNFSVTVVSGSVTNFGTLAVSGGPKIYTVQTQNSITGEGEFRLDLTSITDIVDCASNGLTGTFTSGETYIRDVTAPSVVSVVRYNPTTQYIKTSSYSSTVFRVTFSEPINASTVAAGDFTFTVVSGSISSPSISSVSQVNTTTWDVTVTGWTSSENAEFRLHVNANGVSDLAGNTGPTSAFTGGQTYILDNSNPTATFDQANNCYPSITQLTGTASDAGTPASGVATVEVAIWKDNNRNGSFDSGTDFYWGGTAFDQSSPTWNTATYISPNWSYSITINSGDYDYYVSVRVTDNAGNQATAVTNSKVTVDAVAPVLTVTWPTAGAYSNGSQTVVFSVSDANPGSTQASFDGSAWSIVTSGTTTMNSITGWTSLSEGSHYIYFEHTDCAGNYTIVGPIPFTKDVTAPTITSFQMSCPPSNSGTITFSEPVYANSNGTGNLTSANVSVTKLYGSATMDDYSITHTAGSTSATVNISWSGTLNGNELVTVGPQPSSIYDAAGNVMSYPSSTSDYTNVNVTIVSYPTDKAGCVGTNVTFTGSATGGAGLQYRWQESTDNGSSWSDLSDGGVYSGTTTTNLQLTGITSGMDGYQYRLKAYNECDTMFTNAATLTVYPATAITTQPSNPSVCVGSTATLTVYAVGQGLNYQWQYWNGSAWVNVSNGTPSGATYTGGTSATLQISGLSAGSYQYRVIVYGTCAPTTVPSNTATVTVNAAPTATISGSTTICSGSSATLTLTLTGTSPWTVVVDNYGTINGITSSPYYFNVSPTTNTTYTITSVTDGNGCSGTGIGSATVTIQVLPTADAGADQNICQGSTASLSGSATNYSSLAWTTSGDGTFSNANSLNTVYTPGSNDIAAGYVTLTLTANPISPCATAATDQVVIYIERTPVAQTINPSPNTTQVCEGSYVSATFSGGSGGNGNDEYQYEYDNSGTWYSYNPGDPILTSGHSQVTVRTRRSGTYCPSSSYNTHTWLIEQTPVAPSITKSPNTTNVCEGATVSATFTGGSGGNGTNTYEYRYDGTGSWSSYTPGTPLSTTGHTLVEIRATRNASVCSPAVNTVSWTVSTSTLSVSCSTSVSVCVGGTLYLNASVSGGSGNYSYSWTGPNGFSSSDQNPTRSSMTSGDAGNYIVTVTDNGTGCVASCTTSVSVNTIPSITSQPTDQKVVYGGSATFSASTSGATSHQWYRDDDGSGYDGSAISGATGTSYNISSAGFGDDGLYYLAASNYCGTQYSNYVRLRVAPTQASGLNGNKARTTISLTWTRGNGDGVLVGMVQGTTYPSDGAPVDGTTYSADTNFSSAGAIGSGGAKAVYDGNGTGVTVTGLLANTYYRVRVYEYKDASLGRVYNTNVTTANEKLFKTNPRGIDEEEIISATHLSVTKLYPNPVTEQDIFFTVFSPANGNCYIEIVNLTGEVVEATTLEVREGANDVLMLLEISGKRLPAGTYFLKVTAFGETIQQPFVYIP